MIQGLFEELRWKKFPVLNDGFVTLVDVMGDDASVVQAARVSYGQDIRDKDVEFNTDTTDFPTRPCNICGSKSNPQYKGDCNSGCLAGEEGPTYYQKQVEKNNRNLIRYMMRHNHGTPFEMAEVKLLVRVPMDCWRQWIRHRTANVNEYSTRYSEAIDSQQATPPDQWRLQSQANKQGSGAFLEDWPKEIKPHGESLISAGSYLSQKELSLHLKSRELYEERIKFGVAREQARKDLPLSTYTEAYWKCDLRNIFHFLGLRMDSHAQLEIRQYATIIGEQIIKPLFPLCWEAFQDYQLMSVKLTRLDVEAIRTISSAVDGKWEIDSLFTNKREKEECLKKLELLGLI